MSRAGWATRSVGLLLTAALALTLAPAAAGAASITVNTTSDGAPAADGSCTLREAITNANADTASSALPGECATGSGADAIDFSAAVRPAITLVSTLPQIKTSMTITGPGASLLDVQRNPAASAFGIFFAQDLGAVSPSLSLSGLTISGGKETGGVGATFGAGINSYGFDLSLDHVIVEDNMLDVAANESGNVSVSTSGAGVSFNAIGADAGLAIKDSVIRDNSAIAQAFNGGPAGGLNKADAAISGVGVSAAGNDVTIERTTISGNSATALAVASNTPAIAEIYGAGIDVNNSNPGPVITASTISGNSASANGAEEAYATGGLFYADETTLDGSTVTGNSAASTGTSITATGGVEGSAGTIVSSTIAGNTTSTPGEIANLRTGFGGATIRNTIVANPLAGANCELSPAPTEDHNLEFPGTSCGFSGTGSLQNVDPSLGALAANGGPTETLALPAGSAALDRIPAAGCALTDQRGLPRPQTAGTPCDMGAYELQSSVVTPPVTPPAGVVPAKTGERERALRRCFRKKFRGNRKKCRKKARKLPS